MHKLLLATRNKGKLIEISALLSGLPFEIHSVLEFPNIPEVVEDGETLEANALKKAREVFMASNIPTIADDSGLEVYSLNMMPGVISARYAGENITYAENNQKLFNELKNTPPELRKARFRCVIAYISPTEERLFEGVCEGSILEEERGKNGFGYDPLFVPSGFSETFAELTLETKNKISHRAQALMQLKKHLSCIK
ncbi:MAG: XTP/dITP diphosphatase [Ignavibacteriae bacterium]|nr:XTP/dITP diphosphatase [Ignavibacteriota bacterium]